MSHDPTKDRMWQGRQYAGGGLDHVRRHATLAMARIREVDRPPNPHDRADRITVEYHLQAIERLVAQARRLLAEGNTDAVWDADPGILHEANPATPSPRR